jgi:tetratricopeptide (TPR) repeat protein
MALVGLLVFVAGLCLYPVQETDLFFRMAAGEQFLRTGHILHRNLFSFTFPDTPYLDPAWLFDVLVAGLYRLGGAPAIVLVKTFIVVALAVGCYRLCRARGASPFASALVLTMAFACMRDRLVERPHVFSLLGEAALFALLPAINTGHRRSWLVVPLVVLWANLHAGSFLATLVLVLAGLGAGLDREPPRTWARYALFSVLTALALLATPVGIGVLDYLSFHVGVFDIHPVDEFRNVTWRSDAPFIVFATVCLVAMAMPPRRPWKEMLPALGVLILAVWHVRFAADATLMLALVAGPAVSAHLGRIDRIRFAAPVLGLALLAVTLWPRLSSAARGESAVAIGIDEAALPLPALRFVERHGLRERMYNDFETGAYLLWQGYPRFRVFTDPRLPAYPAEFHQLTGRMHPSRSEWTQAMDRFGVESALLDYAGINRRMAFWDPADWALVYRARDSRVFVRRLPRWHDLIQALEIPATFDFTIEDGVRTVPLAEPPARSPVPACEWKVRLGDLYFDLDGGKSDRAVAAYRQALAAPTGCLSQEHELAATAWVGGVEIAAGRFSEALPLLDRALTLTPSDTAVLANRAIALAALGRASEARTVWSRIAELAAGTELGKRAAQQARH